LIRGSNAQLDVRFWPLADHARYEERPPFGDLDVRFREQMSMTRPGFFRPSVVRK
jgi:hypothetical protein